MKKIKLKGNKRLYNTILLSIVLVMLLSCLVMAIPFLNENYKTVNTNSNPSDSNNKDKESKEKVYKLSMMMVGDALIHDTVYRDAYNSSTDTYSFKKMLTYIEPYIKDYNLKFYNQETPISGDQWPYTSYPCFNSPKEIGLDMISIGFNMVNLASNHTLDGRRMGSADNYYCISASTGASNSAAFWEEQKDVYSVGSYTSEEKRNEVVIKEMNGIKYALLGYTFSTNGIPIPVGQDYLVNMYSDEQAKKDIEKVRDKVDVLMVSMHWGVEYTHYPTSTQKQQAEYLASLGVDIIIGHHPHVVQPVTWIDDTLVVYSLGNFISAQSQDANYNKMVGLMTMLDITKTVNGNDVKITIGNVKNELLFTYFKNSSNFKVIPFSKIDSTYLSNYESVYNTYKKVIQMYDEDMAVVPLSN